MELTLSQDRHGYYQIPATGLVLERHQAAVRNIHLARRLGHKAAYDYYAGYASALAADAAPLIEAERAHAVALAREQQEKEEAAVGLPVPAEVSA